MLNFRNYHLVIIIFLMLLGFNSSRQLLFAGQQNQEAPFKAKSRKQEWYSAPYPTIPWPQADDESRNLDKMPSDALTHIASFANMQTLFNLSQANSEVYKALGPKKKAGKNKKIYNHLYHLDINKYSIGSCILFFMNLFIQDEHLNTIASRTPNLRSLYINKSDVDITQIEALLRHHPKLERLVIKDTRFLYGMLNIHNHKSLKEITIENCKNLSLSIKNCPSLKIVHFSRGNTYLHPFSPVDNQIICSGCEALDHFFVELARPIHSPMIDQAEVSLQCKSVKKLTIVNAKHVTLDVPIIHTLYIQQLPRMFSECFDLKFSENQLHNLLNITTKPTIETLIVDYDHIIPYIEQEIFNGPYPWLPNITFDNIDNNDSLQDYLDNYKRIIHSHFNSERSTVYASLAKMYINFIMKNCKNCTYVTFIADTTKSTLIQNFVKNISSDFTRNYPNTKIKCDNLSNYHTS